ncbi:FK506-binding protein-like [Bagarius yarrelli]|uniref:FK506-binding protein-like n=1 Tax=Bagarius yarrelli TaxID=175774 RepID=A0A556U2G4_BAGYA|nr:FK506-binding protein-like [Bagarius yarrelli]
MATESIRRDRVSGDSSWISVSPSGLLEVNRRWKEKRKGGDDTPLLGSICKLRVLVKNQTEDNSQSLSLDEAVNSGPVQVSQFPRTQDSVLQVPLDTWFTVRPYQQDVEMAPSKTPAVPSENPGEERQMKRECFYLQLHSFTPGKESWQMLPTEKWTWVLSHKQRGRQRFGNGDIWGATHSYCCAIKLLITLKRHTKRNDRVSNADRSIACDLTVDTEGKSINIYTEEEYKTVKAELHSNLSLCQLRLSQPGKAKDSSSKATALDPANFKAWYRLGQACLQLEDFSKARQAFGKVLELQPGSTSAQNALKQVNAKAKEFDSKLGQRLSKMFT